MLLWVNSADLRSADHFRYDLNFGRIAALRQTSRRASFGLMHCNKTGSGFEIAWSGAQFIEQGLGFL